MPQTAKISDPYGTSAEAVRLTTAEALASLPMLGTGLPSALRPRTGHIASITRPLVEGLREWWYELSGRLPTKLEERLAHQDIVRGVERATRGVPIGELRKIRHIGMVPMDEFFDLAARDRPAAEATPSAGRMVYWPSGFAADIVRQPKLRAPMKGLEYEFADLPTRTQPGARQAALAVLKDPRVDIQGYLRQLSNPSVGSVVRHEIGHITAPPRFVGRHSVRETAADLYNLLRDPKIAALHPQLFRALGQGMVLPEAERQLNRSVAEELYEQLKPLTFERAETGRGGFVELWRDLFGKPMESR